MNVELIAGGRTVRMSDCIDTAENCADFALGLWLQTEPEATEASASMGFTQTEIEHRPTGFADVSMEQMDVR